MRTIPAITLVKATPSLGTVYYIDLAEHEVGSDYRISPTRRLGFVEKDNSKWYAYSRRTDASVSVALGHLQTRKAAVQAVVTVFVRMLAEVEAHEIQDVINAAQARADQDAKPMLEGEDDKHVALVMPLGVIKALNGTSEGLGRDLRSLREYMGRGQGSLREFDINAYVARMIEHELIRRANVEESHAADEFGGDFGGYADAMYRRQTGE
jgi:hypothetical protein